MEIVKNMLSSGRIIRLLSLVLACIVIWKVFEYTGWGRNSQTEPSFIPAPKLMDSDDLTQQNNNKLPSINNSPPAADNELVVEPSALVRVHVYYEPLCPDSRHFVRYQLKPAMEKLSQHLDMQLVPYGKATTIEDGSGKISFRCQHGPTECLANKIHGCVIKHVADQKTQVDLVDCMIADNYKPKLIAQKCFSKVVGGEQWGPVKQCYSGRSGDMILKHMGSITQSLDPEVSFIPTITIDGKQDEQTRILRDFTQMLCKRFKGELPPACSAS